MSIAESIAVRISWEVEVTPELRETVASWRARLDASLPVGFPDEVVVLPVLPEPADERLIMASVQLPTKEGSAIVGLAISIVDQEDDAEELEEGDGQEREEAEAAEAETEDGADESRNRTMNAAAAVVGGSGPVRDLLGQFLPLDAVVYRITFSIDGTKSACSLLPKLAVPKGGADSAILRLAPKAVREHVGFKLDGGILGITEIQVSYLDSGQYQVIVLASGVVALGAERWLPFADEVAQLIAKTLFPTN